MGKQIKVAAISLREAARRAEVSYPTALRYKHLGWLNEYIVPGLDKRIVFRPSVAKLITKLRDEGYNKRGRPREILVNEDGA